MEDMPNTPDELLACAEYEPTEAQRELLDLLALSYSDNIRDKANFMLQMIRRDPDGFRESARGVYPDDKVEEIIRLVLES